MEISGTPFPSLGFRTTRSSKVGLEAAGFGAFFLGPATAPIGYSLLAFGGAWSKPASP